MPEFPKEVATFSTWDYVLFAAMLAVSAAIGIYQAVKMKMATKTEGADSTTEFVLAGRSMSALPVALSLLASFLSTSTLLGVPVEIYNQGTMFWLCAISLMFAPLLGAYVFGPFFRRMQILSVFEYLGKRYESVAVRLLGSVLFILRGILTMGVVMFGPALALSTVTPFPVWSTVVVIGVLCAFYTALGGMKAVIWTDVFQAIVIVAGVIMIIIQGSIEVGGISRAWKIAEEGNRIHFFDFNPDPTIRHTFWSLMIGVIFTGLPQYTIDQQMIQRFCSIKSLKQAVRSLLMNMPGTFIIITLCCLEGLVMYAYYAECDPLKRGIINNPNQLLPRFCMDILGWVPGLPGLFVASLLSASLSTVSSILNSLATITWQDFCRLSSCARKMTDGQSKLLNQALALAYAATGIGMAFAFSQMGGTLIQGASIGAVVGFAIPMWISIGASVTSPPVYLPVNFSIAGCPVENTSSVFDNVTASWLTTDVSLVQSQAPGSVEGIVHLYTLSYWWYPAVGFLLTVLIGLLVSFATGYTRAEDVDPDLLLSYVDKLWCCFPESCRRRCRCGIDFDRADAKKENGYDADWMPGEKEEGNVYCINLAADDQFYNNSMSTSTIRDLSL